MVEVQWEAVSGGSGSGGGSGSVSGGLLVLFPAGSGSELLVRF